MANRPLSADARALDEALASGLTIDEILAGAKASLGRGDRLSNEIGVDALARRNLDTRYRYLAENPEHTYGDVATDALRGAALPAAFLSGPVGMAAGGYFALNAIKNLVRDPSMGNAIMAGLSAIPGAAQARGAYRGAQAAKATQAARSATRESVGMARDLKDIGYQHSTAGRIAGVPSRGKSEQTIIRHLSQLPDEDALAASLAGSRAGRQTPIAGDNAAKTVESLRSRVASTPSGTIPGDRRRSMRDIPAPTQWRNAPGPGQQYASPEPFGFNSAVDDISDAELTRLQEVFRRLRR